MTESKIVDAEFKNSEKVAETQQTKQTKQVELTPEEKEVKERLENAGRELVAVQLKYNVSLNLQPVPSPEGVFIKLVLIDIKNETAPVKEVKETVADKITEKI